MGKEKPQIQRSVPKDPYMRALEQVLKQAAAESNQPTRISIPGWDAIVKWTNGKARIIAVIQKREKKPESN